jgi:hypothetical protein
VAAPLGSNSFIERIIVTPQNANSMLSLHRYFIWADRMRSHFYDLLLSGNHATAKGEIEGRLYMSYWYAGLYVVTDGWKELGLSDARIDGLLDSPNLNLLRRYRNGTFHFQSEYNDQRFTELIEQGTDVVTWVRELNQQFGRFFLEALSDPTSR